MLRRKVRGEIGKRGESARLREIGMKRGKEHLFRNFVFKTERPEDCGRKRERRIMGRVEKRTGEEGIESGVRKMVEGGIINDMNE